MPPTCPIGASGSGCSEAEVAAISGHDIDQVRRILETYLPRTGTMAAAAIAKLEDARAARETRSERMGNKRV